MATDQGDLFGNTHARADDPDTSKETAESLDVTRQALRVLWAYAGGKALLDHEAYKLVGFADGRTSHQRCSDLRERGMIVRVGTGTTPFGKPAQLCRITQRGREYLRDSVRPRPEQDITAERLKPSPR